MKVKDIIKDNSKYYENSKANDNPFFSIILPTYSRAKNHLLEKCLNSILKQSYRNFELIIVDDGSVDGTFDICLRYMKLDNRIRIIRHKNNIGLPAISEYEGYKISKGKYISFAFDDNIWYKDALMKTYLFIQRNNSKAVFGITNWKTSNGKEQLKLGLPHRDTDVYFNNYIGNGAVILSKEVIEEVGLYDPHLALTRTCDWDLWTRISNIYKFIPSEIEFCFEKGNSLNDSLCNTRLAEPWLMIERMQHRNIEQLKPQNYEDIDILGNDCTVNSKLFYEKLLESFLQYRGKKWFDIQEACKLKNSNYNESHRHVIFCSEEGLSASLMSFVNYKGSNLSIYYFNNSNVDINVLKHSNIIILNRSLISEIKLQIIKKMNIPIYYYVDDCLEALVSEKTKAVEDLVEKYYNGILRKYFDGVIVSSYELKKYFLKFSSNVILLHPTFKKRKIKNNNKLSLAFIGGKHREKMFIETVVPALNKIAKEFHFRLICPKRIIDRKQINKNIDIYEFDRTINYELLMNNLSYLGVDILIHCGDDIPNNKYKTKNALINASELRALLIVSNVLPYSENDVENDIMYLTSDNTTSSWEKILFEAISNNNLRNRITEKAVSYCFKTYNSTSIWKDLENELILKERVNDKEKTERVEIYNDICEALLINYKEINPDKICCTGKTDDTVRYRFVSDVTSISEYGLLFAKFGKPIGKILLIIKDRNEKPLSNNMLNIDDIEKEGYTNIVLKDVIDVNIGDLLFLDVSYIYNSESDGFIEIFEERKYPKVFYKYFSTIRRYFGEKKYVFIDLRSKSIDSILGKK